MIDASSTRPFRSRYMYRPTKQRDGNRAGDGESSPGAAGTTRDRAHRPCRDAGSERPGQSDLERSVNASGNSKRAVLAPFEHCAPPARCRVPSAFRGVGVHARGQDQLGCRRGYFTSSPPSALTTTFPRPARAMMRMKRMAMLAAAPATGPMSSQRQCAPAIVRLGACLPPSERKSCTAPARHTPTTIQSNPGM